MSKINDHLLRLEDELKLSVNTSPKVLQNYCEYVSITSMNSNKQRGNNHVLKKLNKTNT